MPAPVALSARAAVSPPCFALFAIAASAWGCASIPRGAAAIDSVRIVGASAIAPADLTDKLSTTASPKFLGLFRGVADDYSIYDASVLQRDLARIERFYRGRGFFEAHARGARVIHASAEHVRVEIVVDEGNPVINRDLRLEGIDGLPADAVAAARMAAGVALPKGKRFDEGAYREAQTALLRALTDRGYAYAKLHADARVDLPAHVVDYAFAVSPGIPAVYGSITFVGLDPDGAGPRPQEIDEKVLRRVMHVREGKPYSAVQIDAATQALLDLEVFSAVHVVPELADPPRPVVPLVVQVQPAELRAVRLGAGAELDNIKADAHLIAGWEDHNLLGGLRDFSVDLRPGVVLDPTNVAELRPPDHLFYEQRLRLQFRQPGAFEARTTAFVRPELNIFPLIVAPAQVSSGTSTSTIVPSYIEPKVSVGVERRFGKHLFATLAYNFQGERPFTYPWQSSHALPPTALLSFPELVTQIDFRDDAVHTHAGVAANIDLQFAGGPFGGTASDIRFQPDIEGYVPITRRVTFALSGTLGLLFPFDYGHSVETGLPGQASDVDIQTMYFRGFFSGGPNSNRGYPLRGVAPHGYVGFLNPATAAVQTANKCNPNQSQDASNIQTGVCAFPIGGFTQWEASAELRFGVSGPFGGVLFCDAGDVSEFVLFRKYPANPSASALRFNHLHMSCGIGARYDTSVVPVRLDIGYRIPGLQVLGNPLAYDPTYGNEPYVFSVLPIAVAFGIGESF